MSNQRSRKVPLGSQLLWISEMFDSGWRGLDEDSEDLAQINEELADNAVRCASDDLWPVRMDTARGDEYNGKRA